MQKYFLSDKNVGRLNDMLGRKLNIKKNSAKQKCKKLLVDQMKQAYVSYNKRKPKNMSATDFLDFLNKKSVSNCLSIINRRADRRKKKEVIKCIPWNKNEVKIFMVTVVIPV